MAEPKLSRLELRIMEMLGTRQHSSLRETSRPAYTTVQTTGYRVESKKAVHRVKEVVTFTSSKLQLPVMPPTEG